MVYPKGTVCAKNWLAHHDCHTRDSQGWWMSGNKWSPWRPIMELFSRLSGFVCLYDLAYILCRVMMRRVVGKYLIYAPNGFGLRRNVAISAFSSVLRNPLWRNISHSLALFENVEDTFACTILVCTVNLKNRSVAIMHSNNADIVCTSSITDGRPGCAMSEIRLLSIVKTFDTAYC